MNGVNGYEVIGPNGNSIFFPAAGLRVEDKLRSVGSNGYYWASVRSSRYPDNALGVYFTSNGIYDAGDYRSCGKSIRAVTK